MKQEVLILNNDLHSLNNNPNFAWIKNEPSYLTTFLFINAKLFNTTTTSFLKHHNFTYNYNVNVRTLRILLGLLHYHNVTIATTNIQNNRSYCISSFLYFYVSFRRLTLLWSDTLQDFWYETLSFSSFFLWCRLGLSKQLRCSSNKSNDWESIPSSPSSSRSKKFLSSVFC